MNKYHTTPAWAWEYDELTKPEGIVLGGIPASVKAVGAWLQAQRVIEGIQTKKRIDSIMLSLWASLYITTTDIEEAARLMELEGQFPFYNISSDFMLPHRDRLVNIPGARYSISCPSAEEFSPNYYKSMELYYEEGS